MSRTKKNTEDPETVRVKVVCVKAELGDGLTVILKMKTDTPELPAAVAEALQTLSLVEIK